MIINLRVQIDIPFHQRRPHFVQMSKTIRFLL